VDPEQQKEYREIFEKIILNLRGVRHISSPTAKIEFISNFMTGIRLEEGELQNADGVVNLFILGLLSMGKRSSDLFVEIKYIQAFSSEDLFHVV
jgi:hypothetical protein